MFAEKAGGLIQQMDPVLRLAAANGGGSDHKRAIFYGFGEGFELLGAGQQRRGTDGGTRLAKSQFVGIHDAKMEETEVAHGASGGTDIERIARSDKNNPQAIGFGIR